MFLVQDAEHGVFGGTKYNTLPSFNDALAKLRADVAADSPLNIPAEFAGLSMSDDGAIRHAATAVDMACTKHSLSQMVSRIKPHDVVGMAGYLAACPPDLRALNFNYWHQEFFGPQVENPVSNDVVLRLVRRDQQLLARAVVSKQYVPVDDLPIISTLHDIMPTDGKARFVRGDVKSYYSIFWADRNKAVGKDEVVAGIRIINSETGSSSAYIVPIYYSMRTGGCLIMGAHSRKTVGIRHIGQAERLLTKTYKSVADTVDANMERLREAATDYPMGFDTSEELAVAISKYLTLPVESVIAAIESCDEDMPNRASIASAVAAQANDVHISKAEDIEIAAGKMITVSWATLARHKHADE